MEIVGYADRFSVAPGETVRFHVSCMQPSYQADIVRLIHGDPNPKGPGFKEELVATPVSGEYPGRRQDIHTGSHIIVPDAPLLGLHDGFTLHAWIYPTTPQKGVQGILTKWSEAEGGYGLVLDEGGVLAVWLTDPAGHTEQVRINTPLRSVDWYFVAATFDAHSGQDRRVSGAVAYVATGPDPGDRNGHDPAPGHPHDWGRLRDGRPVADGRGRRVPGWPTF